MSKPQVSDYDVLDEIEHVRRRTGMYAGSTELQTSVDWIYDPNVKKMVKKQVSYIPALIKIFSEILDNAIDEHRRAPQTLDSIRVDFTADGVITITDNGRGIPVEIHPKTGKYIAETVFTTLRAGSNFDDSKDQQLVGTNGVGSTLTSILSTFFKVESCDGKKVLTQEFRNGLRERDEPKIKADNKNRTKITFKPDYAFFKLPGLDADHAMKMTKKIADAAACNPGVKFYINGDRIAVKDFGDYISLYTDEFVYDDTPDWKVGISHSDGFEQISFVNSVETYQGGTHVAYVMDQIVEAIRTFIKKKYKTEVKPADVRNHMRVYISANVNRPKFSSQTKENMISQYGTYKTSWDVPDKMIQKLLKSPIIQSVLDWVEAKQKAAEMAELRKLNKEAAKANPRRVEKFDDAIEKVNRHQCEVFFTEGDCLFEDTKVLALTGTGQRKIAIKDVSAGDAVLTHKNRFKTVLSKSSQVKKAIKLSYEGKTLLVSEDHRMLVFDRNLQQFGYIAAKHIDNTKHQLVENKIAATRIFADDVLKIEVTDTGYHIITAADEWDMTPEHKIMIMNAQMEMHIVEAKHVKIGDSIIMSSMEQN